MRKIQVISALLLLAAVFVSVDLGINYAASLLPELSDGVGSRSILQGILGIFGGSGWTRVDFPLALERSLWGTFALFGWNIAVGLYRTKDR